LVLIGPGAGQTIATGETNEKAAGLPQRQIGTFEALKRYSHSPSAKIAYAVADDMNGVPVPAMYLSHEGRPGLKHDGQDGIAYRTSGNLNFSRSNGNELPANTSQTWSGTLQIPSSGKYSIYLQMLGCYASLTVDDKVIMSNGRMYLHGDITQAGQSDELPTADGLASLRSELQLASGPHEVSVSVSPDGSESPTEIRLSWVTPQEAHDNYNAAILAARQAKTAVVFAWSRDTPVFRLPGNQDQLIADVAAANPNTIVVLNVCQPVLMPWLKNVKAVLNMWWPGDEGGWATAKLLLGKVSPAGRLPFTWGQRLEDYPATDPAYPERRANGVDGKTRFSEGIFVGYRWFDYKKILPLFPFGYGLSYSRFDYSDLKIDRATDGGLDVKFRVRNNGQVTSDEVPQIYLDAPSQPPREQVHFADHALAAFKRISLGPHESKSLSLHVPPRALEYWSPTSSRWVLAAGMRSVHVGVSSQDFKLEGIAEITQ
jgi:beta-glucosidase